MNYINVIQLLFRIVDNDRGEEKMLRHSDLFILFLCVQLLIIVVHIYSLMLSDMDTVEMIPHILGS